MQRASDVSADWLAALRRAVRLPLSRYRFVAAPNPKRQLLELCARIGYTPPRP